MVFEKPCSNETSDALIVANGCLVGRGILSVWHDEVRFCLCLLLEAVLMNYLMKCSLQSYRQTSSNGLRARARPNLIMLCILMVSGSRFFFVIHVLIFSLTVSGDIFLTVVRNLNPSLEIHLTHANDWNIFPTTPACQVPSSGHTRKSLPRAIAMFCLIRCRMYIFVRKSWCRTLHH